ncbi:MAG: type sorting protein [Flavipsychrobacter sp.]|jgi:hypothetical protein|nr:type sorting protein [Flavipsychrobacter sp.]
MRFYTIILLSVFLCGKAHAGKKIKVLFIGNSLTYVNDLPLMIANMAQSTGDTLVYDSYTIGGYRFIDHGFDTMTAKKIRSAKWDYVVLQEQSRMPSRETNYFFNTSYTWARNLDTLIQGHDPCAKTMFYMTWGYKDGDSLYCSMYPSWPHVCTYEGMDSIINLHYRYYADTALAGTVTGWHPIVGHRNAHVTPAGAVWRYIRQHHPSIELYWPDGVHPSEAGSYAAACAFYTTLFRKDPAAVPYSYTLPAADAANIRAAAKAIVYDSSVKWKIGIEDLRAQFTYSTSGSTATFANTSTEALSYMWNFGDGSISAATAPVHSYTATGTYTVRLIAYDAGCSDTSYSLVSLSATGIETQQVLQAFTVSPNPATNSLSVVTDDAMPTTINIYDVTGALRLHAATQGKSTTLQMTHLPRGLYIVEIVSDKTYVVKKVLLQ